MKHLIDPRTIWEEDQLWNDIKEIVGDYPATIFNLKKLFLEYESKKELEP